VKFTLSWLKEHLDTTAEVDAVAEAMTMAGLEVEEVHDPVAALAPFTVARSIWFSSRSTVLQSPTIGISTLTFLRMDVGSMSM